MKVKAALQAVRTQSVPHGGTRLDCLQLFVRHVPLVVLQRRVQQEGLVLAEVLGEDVPPRFLVPARQAEEIG